jgi:hypothetical protein
MEFSRKQSSGYIISQLQSLRQKSINKTPGSPTAFTLAAGYMTYFQSRKEHSSQNNSSLSIILQVAAKKLDTYDRILLLTAIDQWMLLCHLVRHAVSAFYEDAVTFNSKQHSTVFDSLHRSMTLFAAVLEALTLEPGKHIARVIL